MNSLVNDGTCPFITCPATNSSAGPTGTSTATAVAAAATSTSSKTGDAERLSGYGNAALALMVGAWIMRKVLG